MLTVNALSSGYGRIPIVRGVSFTVGEGEAVGILGHNGMGKTTLLKSLAGHIRPTHGQVHLAGTSMTDWPPAKRARLGLGYVPQGRQIFPNLSVLDNLRIGAAGAGLSDSVLEQVVEDLPRLKPILQRLGGVLSGGEQQILALGRCLCGYPKLVLLDEPTEGIQPSIIHEMIDLLRTLRSKRNLTIVLVEQNLDFIRLLSERVFTFQKGAITGEVRPEQLNDPVLVSRFLGMNKASQAA